MNAAKMVADSTSCGDGNLSKKRKSIDDEKRKLKSKKMVKKSKGDGEYDGDLDLSKPLYPIVHYITSRVEMIEQLFHCVAGASLKRSLPDALRELPLVDLKTRCLRQLEVMSKKRIRRILQGDDPDEISSSGTDEDSDSGQTKDKISQEEGQESRNESELNEQEAGQVQQSIMTAVDDNLEPTLSHTEMEILELQMRARAIKAMLKAQSGGAPVDEKFMGSNTAPTAIDEQEHGETHQTPVVSDETQMTSLTTDRPQISPIFGDGTQKSPEKERQPFSDEQIVIPEVGSVTHVEICPQSHDKDCDKTRNTEQDVIQTGSNDLTTDEHKHLNSGVVTDSEMMRTVNGADVGENITTAIEPDEIEENLQELSTDFKSVHLKNMSLRDRVSSNSSLEEGEIADESEDEKDSKLHEVGDILMTSNDSPTLAAVNDDVIILVDDLLTRVSVDPDPDPKSDTSNTNDDIIDVTLVEKTIQSDNLNLAEATNAKSLISCNVPITTNVITDSIRSDPQNILTNVETCLADSSRQNNSADERTVWFESDSESDDGDDDIEDDKVQNFSEESDNYDSTFFDEVERDVQRISDTDDQEIHKDSRGYPVEQSRVVGFISSDSTLAFEHAEVTEVVGTVRNSRSDLASFSQSHEDINLHKSDRAPEETNDLVNSKSAKSVFKTVSDSAEKVTSHVVNESRDVYSESRDVYSESGNVNWQRRNVNRQSLDVGGERRESVDQFGVLELDEDCSERFSAPTFTEHSTSSNEDDTK